MSLTAEQVQTLLRPINPTRVLKDSKGMSHVSQQDIRAHLSRVFGFGGWSTQVLDLVLIGQDRNMRTKDGKEVPSGWAVSYRCTLRLTVSDPDGRPVASFEDVGSGTSPNLPALGDAHDFAMKVAVSMALKRCATNLGDGFGLSLYNKGQTAPLVIGTLVVPGGAGTDAADDVPEQVSMGHDDAGSSEDNQPDRKAERGVTPPADDQWAKTSDEGVYAGLVARIEKAQNKEALNACWAAMKAAVSGGLVVDIDGETLRDKWKKVAEALPEAGVA